MSAGMGTGGSDDSPEIQMPSLQGRHRMVPVPAFSISHSMKLNTETSWIAAALLIGAAWLGIRNHDAAVESRHRSSSVERSNNCEPLGFQSARRRGNAATPETMGSTVSRNAPSDTSLQDANPGANPEEGSIGVRLGNKVRLPATAIARETAWFATPEIAAANQDVENRFYQNVLGLALDSLAKSRSARKPKDQRPEIPLDENGERTVTVEPGPETERVLQDSDEVFRSLFGNEAYNQRKLEGLMEVGNSGDSAGFND